MLVYGYKVDGNKQQYAAIDEAIRVVQFIRNKCLRLWMDAQGISKNDLQVYCAVLAHSYPFATRLNSQARQASADRAWFAISRFYDTCKMQKSGKKGYPQFQHDNRSVEYKQTGWKLEADGKHLTFTDGCGIGRLRLIGTRAIETSPVKQIKWVRLVRRADGYYIQFGVQAERQLAHVPSGKAVGIDVGLKAFYTDSEGHIEVVAVAPQFTSQDCSGCGERVWKTLSTRTHSCLKCGLVLDRDENAAVNILHKAAERTVGHTGTHEQAS